MRHFWRNLANPSLNPRRNHFGDGKMLEHLRHWVDIMLGRTSAETILAPFSRIEKQLQRLVDRERNQLTFNAETRAQLAAQMQLLIDDDLKSREAILAAHNAKSRIQELRG
jgi:hypothetical protein